MIIFIGVDYDAYEVEIPTNMAIMSIVVFIVSALFLIDLNKKLLLAKLEG